LKFELLDSSRVSYKHNELSLWETPSDPEHISKLMENSNVKKHEISPLLGVELKVMFIVYRILSLLIYTSYHHNFGNSLNDIKIKLNTNLGRVTQVECKEGDSKYDCANCDRQEESNFQGGHSPFFHIQCLCHFHPAPLWINNFEGLKSYPGQQHDVGDEGEKH